MPEALYNLAQRFSAGQKRERTKSREGRHTSHTYSSNRVHVIFSTKGRVAGISEELQPKLWAYMAGIANKQGFQAMIIGGAHDHVHALLVLPPVMPLAKAIQYMKGCSSKWLHENGAEFSWQEGYGAFSVSASQTEQVIGYIKNQKAHHEKRSFEEEFLSFLKRYNVPYDPNYVLG